VAVILVVPFVLAVVGMLAADKQLLDAHLRNELQQLRRLEITNVVNRFQNALTPATLILGFAFESIVELEFSVSHVLERPMLVRYTEPIFYLSTATALSLSLYVTAVSSMGIVFGQRLTIQATSLQGKEHESTVREMNSKFFLIIIALGLAMLGVVVAATAVVWVKDPSPMLAPDHMGLGWAAIVATVIGVALALLTCLSMYQMYRVLHTETPEASDLRLRAQGKAGAADVPEFFVAGDVPTKRSQAGPSS
jgi:hypothetical protein